jgi:hypothetical protein
MMKAKQLVAENFKILEIQQNPESQPSCLCTEQSNIVDIYKMV